MQTVEDPRLRDNVGMTDPRPASDIPSSTAETGTHPDLVRRAPAEQALRAAEALNRAILDAVNAEVAVLDAAGTIVAVNSPWRQFAVENSGRPGEAAPRTDVGTNYLEICRAAQGPGAEGARAVHDGIVAVLERRTESFSHEYPCHAPDRKRWFHLTATALRGPQGGAVVSHTSISAPMELSERLAIANERLALAQSSAGAGVWDWDMRNGKLEWSDALFRLFGLDPARSDASFQAWRGILHPEDAAGAEERIFEAVRTRRPLSSEYRIVLSDGAIRWIHALGKTTLDEAGEAVRMTGICLDVTSRKEAEGRLFATIQRLQALMDALPVGVSFSEDRTCHHVTGNPALLAQFEATSDDNVSASATDPAAAGRRVRYFHQGHELSDAELPLQRAAREGVAVAPTELEIGLPSGRQWFAEVSGAPLRDPRGAVVGGIAVVVDVTERRRAEEALREADRRKDEFLATLAHELRNPLVPIRNAVAIVRLQVALEPTLRRACDLLDRQVQHLVRLIDDLLDVSRISRGKLRLRKERVELTAVLEQTLEVARPLIDGAGQYLDLSLPAQPVYLDADPVRLAQVFANLLDNASKFSEGGGRIRLSAGCAGSEVEVKVEDCGMGIAPEHLQGVFHMFTRLPVASDRVPEGLGIGLALARGLVELHGGHIEAQSAGGGKGSTFTVRLPVSAASIGATQDGPAVETPDIVDPRRILVVDDNRDVLESLTMLLELQGHEVAAARDGLEAVAMAERFHPDLVLLDLGLPRLDGYGACRRIREQAWGRDIKVIALTGWGLDGDRRRTEEAGFDDHLVKPVAPSTLLEIVAKVPRS